MEMQNPLDQLRPNHLPDPVSFWPPAPGWWISALLITLVLVLTGIWLYRFIRNRRYRRQAAAEAKVILQEYQQHNDDCRFAQECNRLLKRTALHAYPREAVARLHGQQWLEFLSAKSGNKGFIQGPGEALGDALYSQQHSQSITVEVDALHSMTLSWIRKHHA